MSGRRASQPPLGLRLEAAPSSDALSVVLRLENDPAHVLDLTGWPGPPAVRAGFVNAVAAWTSTGTGGRRVATLVHVKGSLSQFLRWLVAADPAHGVASLADLTPFHLRSFREFLEVGRSAQAAAEYYSDVCVVLRQAEGLSASMVQEINRRHGKVRPLAPVQRYSREEFTAIRAGARGCLLQAHSRVTAAYRQALGEDGPGIDPARVRALGEILATGRPSDRGGYAALGATCGERRDPSISAARRYLFLDWEEVFAAAVLLACQQGLNLSAVLTSPLPVVHAGGAVMQLDVDKPRRGPVRRFWPELVGDDDGGARAVQLVVEATDPARAYLAAQGTLTNRLLIRWSPVSPAPLFGIPGPQTRRRASWIPAGVHIDFRRLRRSVPGHGPGTEPTHHDGDTHLHYVRTDAQALAGQQAQAASGIQQAADRASQHVQQLMERHDRGPGNDALIANCADPDRHPITQRPCTSGFFSFFDCLECDNAATVSRLLPQQLAALHVLDEMRDVLGQTWQHRFARHHGVLTGIVARHTRAELDAARALSPGHVPTILAALRQQAPR